MPDNAYTLNSDDPEALEEARRLAEAVGRRRQVGAAMLGPGPFGDAGKLLMEQGQHQQDQMGEAGRQQRAFSLDKARQAVEAKLAGSHIGAEGPQEALGGERVPAYQAETARLQQQNQWELVPDPLLKGGMFRVNRGTGDAHYIRPGQLWGKEPPGGQPAPPGTPGGQPGVPGAGPQAPDRGPHLQAPNVDDAAYAEGLKDAGPAGEEIRNLDRSIQNLHQALGVVKARPKAFGMGQDVAGYMGGGGLISGPLKKVVGHMQQNRRSPEDLQARTVVFQNAAQAMRDLGGARAFTPGEQQLFSKSQVVEEDNAKVIEQKLLSALQVAANRRASLRAQAMPHLFRAAPQAQPSGAAPSLRGKYGLPEGAQQ
jgi:hypothetical protein